MEQPIDSLRAAIIDAVRQEDRPEVLAELERMLLPETDERQVTTANPIETEELTLAGLIRSQGFKRLDRAHMLRISEELAIQEPLEDLLRMLKDD